MDARREKMLEAQAEAGAVLILIEARSRFLPEPARSHYLKLVADGMAAIVSAPAPAELPGDSRTGAPRRRRRG